MRRHILSVNLFTRTGRIIRYWCLLIIQYLTIILPTFCIPTYVWLDIELPVVLSRGVLYFICGFVVAVSFSIQWQAL